MPISINAAVLREKRASPVIENLFLDDPMEDEILVRIVGVGVCHTDMVMRDALLPVPLPVVLGHEGAGVVEAVGHGVGDLAVGDHVVLSFSSCGSCKACAQHQPAYCATWAPLNFSGSRADGGTALTDSTGMPVHSHIFGQSSFASHVVVSRRNAVKVDTDLPLELLGPLGCGIQTGAGAVLNACRVRQGSSVAVIGAGAVGLSAVMAARLAGAAIVVAVDLIEQRVAFSHEVGATHGFVATSGSMLDHAVAAGCPTGFDYIIDTTGNTSVCNAAIAALTNCGELALVGAYAPGTDFQVDAAFLMSGGRVVRGVVEGSADPATFIPQLITHYRAGRFPFDRLVRYFDFADIATAIAAGETGQVIKPVLRFP